MAEPSVVSFIASNLTGAEIQGKSVLEVGSRDPNRSLREYVLSRQPASYVGVDMLRGPGVDLVVHGEDLVEKFGEAHFDIVLCCETLEHTEDWHWVLANIVSVCKPGGLILITVPSESHEYHGFPFDHWRFSLETLKRLFAFEDILAAKEDEPRRRSMIKICRESTDWGTVPWPKIYNVVLRRPIHSDDIAVLHSRRYRALARIRALEALLKQYGYLALKTPEVLWASPRYLRKS